VTGGALLLESRRLLLRPFEATDAPVLSDYRSDRDVARYQGWEAPFTEEQARAFIAGMQDVVPATPGSWYQLAIEVKATRRVGGDCAFRLKREDRRQGEIGITLARAFQGRGYASEALTVLLDHLFGTLGLHRVTATCDRANLPSRRLLERLGMRHEATFVENIWFKGAWGDEHLYAVLAREWRGQSLHNLSRPGV